jgi:hypothetical protein
MLNVKWLAVGATLLAAAGPLAAADFSDPTWPCVQRKVERLSVGLMWPEPLTGAAMSAETRAAVNELAATLALRRVDMEAAEAAVEAFAQAQGRNMDLMGEVFTRVFDTLSARRTRIMDGIGKFSLGQIAMSERIDAARTEMEALLAQQAPDFDRIDRLEEQIDWDQRIFTDRQKTITYLCETPTLLEKRLFAIAQILHEAGQPDGG